MPSVNEVTLIGHVGRDAEITYPGGTEICKFSLATSEKYRGEEKTEWHNVVAFRELASRAVEMARKGRLLFVRGKLQTISWEKAGQKHSRTEVVAFRILPLGADIPPESAQREAAERAATGNAVSPNGPIPSPESRVSKTETYNNTEITDEDIPF